MLCVEGITIYRKVGVIMKKFVLGLLVGIMLALGVTSYAISSVPEIQSAKFSPEIKLIVKGETVKTPIVSVITKDNPGYMTNFAPIREICEKLGAIVTWDGKTQTITVDMPEKTPEVSLTKPKIQSEKEVNLATDDPEISLNSEQEVEPELEPESEPELQQDFGELQEPQVQNYLDNIFVYMDGEYKIIVQFYESMNAFDAATLANYTIYLDDKSTLAQTQPSSVQYESSRNRVVLYLSEKLMPEIDVYSLSIAENIRNADGTKIVGPRDPILFAYPYSEILYPDGTKVRFRGTL